MNDVFKGKTIYSEDVFLLYTHLKSNLCVVILIIIGKMLGLTID